MRARHSGNNRRAQARETPACGTAGLPLARDSSIFPAMPSAPYTEAPLRAIALLGLFFLLPGLARATSEGPPEQALRPTAALDEAIATNEINAEWSESHTTLFQQDPGGPLVWPPPPPIDPSRAALLALDVATNEFEAPPLIVTRITSLPAASGLSATQVVERFERNLLRERIVLADRMYRRGDNESAITLLQDLNQYLRNPRNRILNFNRMAAYEFRRQQYEAAANLMGQAAELDQQDAVTRINLAAVLMTLGRIDEALGYLLEIYPFVLDRPQLAFSVHFNLACVYSLKQDTAKSLQNLAIAAQTDPASTLASLGDPQLDPVRSDTRFAELGQALERFLIQNPKK